MDARLEQILVTLAQQYAPQALQLWDQQGDYAVRVPRLARLLANYNLLVIMGDFPQTLQNATQDASTQIQAWVSGYGQLYLRLASALFPSFTQVSAHHTDGRWPMVIFIRGAATPVIQALAGYVAPFIVHRQLDKVVSEVELMGLMEYILDDLEAASLPRNTYKQLVADGTGILKQMLVMPIRQLMLTGFDKLIFTDSQRLVPLPTVPPPEPPTVPEEDSALFLAVDDAEHTHMDIASLQADRAAYNRTDTERLTPTQSMTPPPTVPEEPPAGTPTFGSSVPVFFRPKREGKRRPPVPPLPDNADDKKQS